MTTPEAATREPNLREPTATPKERWPSIVIVSVLVLGLGFFWITIFGRVQGTELNADTLRRREFMYYRVPLLDLQILPATIDDTGPSNVIANQLVAEKLLPKDNSSTGRWDGVSAISAGKRLQGDAEILGRFLDAKDTQDSLTWSEWTENNPRRAARLWKYIQNAAQIQNYTLVPELFEIANQSESTTDDAVGADEFEQQLKDAAIAHWRQIADDLKASGQTERAAQFDDAIADLNQGTQR